MNLTTELEPGDSCCFLHDNKVKAGEVDQLTVSVFRVGCNGRSISWATEYRVRTVGTGPAIEVVVPSSRIAANKTALLAKL